MNEILKSHFVDNETPKVESRIEQDKKFKEIYEKIKNNPDFRLNALEEKFSKTEENFETRFKAFKSAVLEAESAKNQSSIDKLKEKGKKEFDSKKSDILKGLKEKADKTLPYGIGSSVFDWATDLISSGNKEGSGFFTKVGASIGLFILGLFGLKKGWENYSSMKFDGKNEQDVKLPTSKEEVEIRVKDTLSKLKERSPEKSKEVYYRGGKELIKNLLDDNIRGSDDFGIISDRLKDLSLSEIERLNFDEYKEKFNGTENKDTFEKYKKNMIGADMAILYDNFLTSDNIENLLEKDRFKNILSSIGITSNENFDWKVLSLEKIFLLFSMVSVNVVSSGISMIPGVGQDIFNKILLIKSSIPGFEELKDDLIQAEKDFEENIISKETVAEILKTQNLGDSGSFDFTETNFKQVSDKEKLKELLLFRDFIENSIIKNPKYNLGHEDLVKKSFSFKGVLHLYVLQKGSTEINNFNSSYLYMYISKILKNKSGAYIKDLGKETVNESSNIINEKEQKLLKVLGKKIIDKSWLDELLASAEKFLDATVDEVKENPEIVAYIVGIIALLRFTPAGRITSVLYAVVGRRGIAFLAGAGIFAYFYNQLDVNMQKELKDSKEYFKDISPEFYDLLKKS